MRRYAFLGSFLATILLILSGYFLFGSAWAQHIGITQNLVLSDDSSDDSSGNLFVQIAGGTGITTDFNAGGDVLTITASASGSGTVNEIEENNVSVQTGTEIIDFQNPFDVATDGSTEVNVSFDFTEVNDTTWGDNTDDFIRWIFNPTGTTNPAIQFSDGTVTLNDLISIVSTGTSTTFIQTTLTGVGAISNPAETLHIGAATSADLGFTDLDTTDDDVNALISVNCTNTTSGAEECDFTIGTQEDGLLQTFIEFDANLPELVLGTINTTRMTLEAGNNGSLHVHAVNNGIHLTNTPITQPEECMTLSAGAGTPDGAGALSPCAMGSSEGSNFTYPYCAFDTSADEGISWQFRLPVNLGSNTDLTFSVEWTPDLSTACGAGDGVAWSLATESFANDEEWNTGSLTSETVVTDDCTSGDTDRIYFSSITTHTHSMDPDERAVVRVFRDVSNGDDTYAADAHMLALRICYRVDNVFSGESL